MNAISKPAKITAKDINAALKVKYPRPEWCIFFEVSAGTGSHANRYADAVAMSIWPSRGYRIHGHEVKVSRSDFMAEMKDPTKADDVGRYCDFWWLVTPAGLVKPEEIPSTWGLMELTGAGMRVKVQAPQRDAANMDRGFASAMIRRAADMESALVQAEVDKHNANREKTMLEQIEYRTKDLRDQLNRRDDWAREFEDAFGMKPSSWIKPANFAEKIKAAELLSGEYGALTQASDAAERLFKIISEIKNA